MADNAANRLVIAITGDTSQIEQQLRGLESRAAKIMRGAEGGANKPSVLAAEQRRMGAEARANAQIETAASKERAAGIALEIAQLRAKAREMQGLSGAQGMGSGLDPKVAAGLSSVSTRLTSIRRESKSVGMEMYRNIGNPFLVVSSLSQRMTGFYGMQRDAEAANVRMERLNDLLQRAVRQGKGWAIPGLLKGLDQAATKVEAINKKMRGPGMVARGVLDFGLNQFMTAGLFGIFQLNTMLLQAIMTPIIEGATKMFRGIFDQAGLAREKFVALAEAVKSAGGAAAYAASIGASPGSRAEEVAGIADLMQRQISYAEKLTAYVNALSSVGELQNEGQKAIFEALKTVAPALRSPTQAASERFQYGMSPSEQIASNYTRLQTFFATFGPEQTAKFNELYQAAGGTSMSFKSLQDVVAKVVTGMFELTDAQTSQRTKIQEAISKFQAQQQLDQLERERWSLTGSMEGIDRNAGADKWFIAAANAAKQQERWQRAAAGYSQQLTRRQQRQTLGQAAADVTRAGIGRPGQSGFELAAAVLEARARAQEARQQIDIQRKQEAIQRKIEYWGSVQANADRQQRILANAVALGMQQAQMALTVDPASGQLLARFVASDVWKMISGAIANNTPTPTNTGGR